MKKRGWIINYISRVFNFTILESYLIRYIFGWIIVGFLTTIVSYYSVVVIYRIFN